MKLSHLTFFLRRNLRRRPGRTATALVAIAVGVAIFHLMAALSLVLRTDVLDKIETIFPERSLIVRQRSVEIGPLAFSPDLLMPQITTATVERIAALAEVESVWPQLPLTVPAMAVGNLMGYEGKTDIVIYGIPGELVEHEVAGPRGFTYADPSTATMPVMVSRFFIDMFNLGLAESQGLPKLTDKAVVGRGFDLLLGQSLLEVNPDLRNVRKIRCEIVGLTQNPTLLGAVAPIEYVRKFNRWYLGDRARETYPQVHVMVRSPEDVDVAAEKIETMGLRVEGRRETAQRLRLAVNGAAVILLLFGLAVLAMAIVNIINTFALIMIERRDEIGLLRAVGATRRVAMGLLLAESFVIGLAGGTIGSGAAWGAARLLNRALREWLPRFSLSPDHWFDPRAGLFVFCVLLATAGSVAAAAPQLWRSVRRWPADLLRES